LTCTGVSFAHGSNDGQKGMGLIMLILIGTVPTAYALNHAVSPQQMQAFVASSRQTVDVLTRHLDPSGSVGDPRADVTAYVSSRTFTPSTVLGLRQMVNDIATELASYTELRQVPADRVRNFRNDLYLISEALRLMEKSHLPKLDAADAAILHEYRRHVDNAT